MSIISSYFSSRPPSSRSHARHPSMMDNVLAIAAGLALRFVVDAVTQHDPKLTGTLVGFWEGIVMQHFLRRMRKSYDPYIAYAVRLFIDFLMTESLERLALVILWTAMGMVLAEIAPAFWVDAGLKRFWRRFRRDLYIMQRSMPKISLFPRSRTVRFSSSSRTAPSADTTASTNIDPPQAPPHRLGRRTPVLRKRPIPGAFPDFVSETDTDIASVRSPVSESSAAGTLHSRFSLFPFPIRRVPVETASEVSSSRIDLDDGNISSSESSHSYSIGTSVTNPADIPDEEDSDSDTEREDADREANGQSHIYYEGTPIQGPPPLPKLNDPMFADARPESVTVPPASQVPNIPDTDEGWDHVTRAEATSEALMRSSGSTPPQQVPPPVELKRWQQRRRNAAANSTPVTPMTDSTLSANAASPAPPPTLTNAPPPQARSSTFDFEDNRSLPPSYHASQGALHGTSVVPDLKNIHEFGAANNNPPPSGDLPGDLAGNNQDAKEPAAEQPPPPEEAPPPPEPEPTPSPDPPIEPLQAPDSGRLEQVLEMRKRAADLHHQLGVLRAKNQSDLNPDITAKIGKLSRDLCRLSRKANVWHDGAYSGITPPAELDLSTTIGATTTTKLKDTIVQCLLKNQRTLDINLGGKKVGKTIKPGSSKPTVTTLLSRLSLQFQDAGKMITIQLPYTPALDELS